MRDWTSGCNYVETENPFGLAKPPDVFLRSLFLKNPRAVIFPSVAEPVYRFCERVKGTPGILKVLLHKPDTKILWANHLLGVTSIMPTAFMLEGGWSDRLIDSLEAIRVDRLGGDTGVDRLLTDRDEDREQRQLEAEQSELDARNSSAWEAVLNREGHRVFITGYEGSDGPAPTSTT